MRANRTSFGLRLVLALALLVGLGTASAGLAEKVHGAAITQLVFSITAQTVKAGVVSSKMTVQTRNASNTAEPVTSNTTVNLTSTSGTGTFYSDSAGTAQVTSVTINTSANSADFYYKDTTIGAPTITAAESPDAGWTDATQVATIVLGVNITVDANPLQAGTQTTITVAKNNTFPVDILVQPQDTSVQSVDAWLSFDKNYVTVDTASYTDEENIQPGTYSKAFTIASGDQLGEGMTLKGRLRGTVGASPWVLGNMADSLVTFYAGSTAHGATTLGGVSIPDGTNLATYDFGETGGAVGVAYISAGSPPEILPDQLGAGTVFKSKLNGSAAYGSVSLTNVAGATAIFAYGAKAMGTTILGGTSITANTHPSGTLFGVQNFRQEPTAGNTGGYTGHGAATSPGGTDPSIAFPMFFIRFKADAVTPPEGTQITFTTATPRKSGAFKTGNNLANTLTGITVIVQEAPTANFTADQTTVTAGTTVAFTDTSTGGPSSWSWNFGDGSPADTSQNPTHQYTVAGAYTVTLTATNSLGDNTVTKTDYITVNPGTPHHLTVTTQTGGLSTATLAAGGTLELKIKAYDQYNNLLNGGPNAYSGTKGLDFSGPLTSVGGNQPQVEGVNVVGGTTVNVSFTDGVSAAGAATLIAYNAQSTIVNASDITGGINSSSNSAFGLALTVNSDVANKLEFSTQPAADGGATVDAPLATQPVVQIVDTYGNLRTADTATISLSAVKAPGNTEDGDGILTGTTSKPAVSGVASFTGIGYTKLDTIHIKAQSSGLTAAISTADIALLVGAPAKLAYNPAPGATQTAGVAWTEFKAEIRDQYDNLTASTATVTLTPSAGSWASGVIQQPTAGVAIMGSITYNTAATITVTTSATGQSWTPAQATVTVGPAPANKLAFSVQPASTGSVDAALTTQPTVLVQDQFGNLVTGDSTTSITLSAVTKASGDTAAGAGSITVTGTGNTNPKTVGSGIVTFAGIGYTKLDTIHIKATSSPVLTPAVSTTDITLVAGAPNKLAFSPEPATPVVAGQTWTEFKVEIRDQYDNLTTSTASVDVTPSAGSWFAGTRPKAAVAGVATFSDMKYTTAATITVAASSAGLTGATSSSILVNPSSLDHIDITPANPTILVQGVQGFTAGGKDVFNNTVPSLTFAWTVPGAQAAAGSINPTTGVFTAGVTPGVYTGAVVATSGSISGSTNVTVQGATLTVTAVLQGGQRRVAEGGYDVPLTVKLFNQTANPTFADIITLSPLYTMSTTNGKVTITIKNEGTKTVTFTVTDLPVGTYDVALFSPHALATLKNDLTIAASNPTTVGLGTLMEGNANDDEQITGADFSMLLTDYLATSASSNWNGGRCDFDENGQVTAVDFSALAMNFNQLAPQAA